MPLTIDNKSISIIKQSNWLLLFGAVLFMLFMGLRPYSSYSDRWVTKNSSEQFTVFGHYGLAAGPLDPRIGAAMLERSFEVSLAVKLLPPFNNRFHILAQFDSPGSPDPMIIGQWRTNLIIMSGRDYRGKQKLPRFSANLGTHMGSFVEISIIFTPDESQLLVNGQFMVLGPAIPFQNAPERISIGNAPDGNHGWEGQLKTVQLQSELPDQATTRYRFDIDNLPTINNTDGLHPLTVPDPGRFPDRLWIGSLRLEQLMQNNIRDVIINFLGFTPFGFLLFAALTLRHKHDVSIPNCAGAYRFANSSANAVRYISVTTFCALLLSLSIETAQSYIPGRSPHTHDVLLNTLGGAIGAIGLQIILLLLRFKPPANAEPPNQEQAAQVTARNPETPENH